MICSKEDMSLVREKDAKNQESYYEVELCFVECIKLDVLIVSKQLC